MFARSINFAIFTIETHSRLKEQTIYFIPIYRYMFFNLKILKIRFSLATYNLCNIIELKLTTALAYIKQENIV